MEGWIRKRVRGDEPASTNIGGTAGLGWWCWRAREWSEIYAYRLKSNPPFEIRFEREIHMGVRVFV